MRPDEIVAITFTNKAAGEMKERIEGLVGPVARTMWISTFHSMCARILRREAQRWATSRTFTIYDEDDRRRLIKRCLEELEPRPQALPAGGDRAGRSATPRTSCIGRRRSSASRSGGFFAQAAADVYELYEKRSRRDERDGLRRPAHEDGRSCSSAFPKRLQHYQQAFRFVLVDEYQDTNHAQYRLANLLAGEHRNLAVVGDDDQCIYSWRGADIRNILEFERDYPEAEVIRLEQNYRSTQAILDAANAVVTNNRERKGKNLWTPRGEGALVQVVEVDDERAEAQFVASEVQKLLEGEARRRAGPTRPDEIAVLYRTNAQSRVLEEQFGRYAIAYQVIGGPKFYERAEIKRRARLPHGASSTRTTTQRLLRIVNVPKRGIGATSLQRLQAHAAERRGDALWAAMRGRRRRARALAGRGQRPARASCASSRACRRRSRARPVAEVVRSVLEESGYEAGLKAQTTLEAEGRLENLEEFVGVRRRVRQARRRAQPRRLPAGDLAVRRHRRVSPTRARSSR